MEALVKWITDNGGFVDNALIQEENDTVPLFALRCVKTTRFIRQGETLFSIPRHLLLRADIPIDDVASNESDEEPSWVPLMLTLLRERENPQSFFRPYLLSLPSHVDTPIFWTESEREWLKGTATLSLLTEQKPELFLKEFLPAVRRGLAGETWIQATEEDILLAFHQIGSIISAYSFTEDDETLMVPMADMLNHDAKNNVELQYESDCLKMVALCDIEAGNEIFNTFGDRTNSELLCRYGFVLNEGPECVLEIKGNQLLQGSKVVASPEERIEILLEMEVLDDAFEWDKDGPSEACLTAMAALAMDEKTWRLFVRHPAKWQRSMGGVTKLLADAYIREEIKRLLKESLRSRESFLCIANESFYEQCFARRFENVHSWRLWRAAIVQRDEISVIERLMK